VQAFRFGIQLSAAADAKAWRSTARKLEDLGYSTLFIPDHFGDQFGPLVALTVAAEATTTLKVGSLVLDNDYRHPLVLAKELATLDLASEGRFEAGLGAGWLRSDYDAAGIAYDAPGVRVTRLEEAVRVMKALWAVEGPASASSLDANTDGRDRPDRVSFEGAHYQIREAAGSPRPYTPGGPPLLIGGGSRRVLRLAAEHASIVGINPSLREGSVGPATIASAAPERYAERIAYVREAAGERIEQIELQSLVFLAEIGRPAAEAAEATASLFGFAPEDVAASPVALFGTEEEIVETLQRRREEAGLSYWVLHEPEIDSFAPVVARLAGS
jgi:probable F420-dependent oxidoreductase